MVEYLRQQKTQILTYLDNWLLYHQSRDRVLWAKDFVLETIIILGFIPNYRSRNRFRARKWNSCSWGGGGGGWVVVVVGGGWCGGGWRVGWWWVGGVEGGVVVGGWGGVWGVWGVGGVWVGGWGGGGGGGWFLLNKGLVTVPEEGYLKLSQATHFDQYPQNSLSDASISVLFCRSDVWQLACYHRGFIVYIPGPCI